MSKWHLLTLAMSGFVGCPGVLAEQVTISWHSQFVDADTVRLSADVFIQGDSFHGFCSSVFSVIGDDDGYSQSLVHDDGHGLGRYFRFDGASQGTIDADNIIGIDQFQIAEMFDSTGYEHSAVIVDFFMFEYTITDFTPRTVTYTSRHENFDVYTDAEGTNIPCDITVLPAAFDISATVVPLPASAMLAGAGLGWVALGRRRGQSS